jgi:hypothetical protein
MGSADEVNCRVKGYFRREKLGASKVLLQV